MNKTQLEQLKTMTTVVVDTGDIASIKAFTPTDATTNPSLILTATEHVQYRFLIDDAVQYAKTNSSSNKGEMLTLLMDKLFVNFGCEILKSIPGRVSTEVDAKLSFDIEGSIKKAHSLIKLYETMGISKERILIKLASTWEGTRAALQLEKEGIHCNMTLLFSLPQAIASAEVNATLVSPFVGRILDWYKKSTGKDYPPTEDPGVKSVRQIYQYFKKFGYKTQIMGASFRNAGEILELAGCDFLTISPQFLAELSKSEAPITRKLDPAQSKTMQIEKINLDEKTFRWMLNEDAMATEKLSEGIRKFSEDYVKLQNILISQYKLEG